MSPKESAGHGIVRNFIPRHFLVLAPLPERATLLPFLQLSKSIIIHKPSYYYLVVLLLYKKFSEKSTKSGTDVRF
jgi:hypothetical protein